MTTLTTKEAQVLEAFRVAGVEACGVSSADEMKLDNMTWARASDLSEATGIEMKVIRGVMSSLSKKGLAQDSGESMENGVSKPGKANNDWFLTDEGIELAWERVAGTGAEADEAPVAPVKDEETVFVTALELAAEQEELARNMGNPFPGIICSTIRAHASGWTGTRKAFIEAGRAVGFNKHTLSTQWQRARGK